MPSMAELIQGCRLREKRPNQQAFLDLEVGAIFSYIVICGPKHSTMENYYPGLAWIPLERWETAIQAVKQWCSANGFLLDEKDISKLPHLFTVYKDYHQKTGAIHVNRNWVMHHHDRLAESSRVRDP